jgi:hypothetical protein
LFACKKKIFISTDLLAKAKIRQQGEFPISSEELAWNSFFNDRWSMTEGGGGKVVPGEVVYIL